MNWYYKYLGVEKEIYKKLVSVFLLIYFIGFLWYCYEDVWWKWKYFGHNMEILMEGIIGILIFSLCIKIIDLVVGLKKKNKE